MDLFSLVAKLTVDTKEYDSEIRSLENQNIEIPAASITLDDSDFQSAVSDAESIEIGDKSVGLDTSDFEQGVASAEELSQGFGGTVTSIFTDIEKAMTMTGIVALVLKLVGALKDAINLTATTGDAIDKGSKALGISRLAYQQWNHALALSGGSINELTRGMKVFNSLATTGKGSEEQERIFSRLGISIKKANGELRTGEELMEETIMAIANIDDETERNNIVDNLFGPRATGVKNLVAATREEIKGMLKEPIEMGTIMSDQDIDNAVNYTDSMTKLNEALDALKITFVEEILPILTQAIDKITAVITFFTGGQKGSFADQMEDVDENTKTTMRQIEATSTMAYGMFDKLIEMGDYTKLTAQQQARWKKTAEWLIEHVPSLSGVIDTETGKIHANTDEIKENIRQWEVRSKKQALMNAKEAKYDIYLEAETKLADKQVELDAAEEEAAMKRSEAIEKYNAFIQNNEKAREYMSGKGYGLLDESMSDNDIHRALDIIGGRTELMRTKEGKAVGAANQEWWSAESKAAGVRKEVEELTADWEKVRDDYNAYSEAFDRRMAQLDQEAEEAANAVKEVKAALEDLPKETTISIIPRFENVEGQAPGQVQMFKQAKGDWIVPYDNYPSLLHRDEMVLTASQARRFRNGGEAVDYNRLAQVVADAIRSGMDGATVNSYLDGRLVSAAVVRDIGSELAAGRFR